MGMRFSFLEDYIMATLDERNQVQIVRKDGKDCFVESLSDTFDIGMAHFVFVGYDMSKPAGERQTNKIGIYVDIAELLELRRKMVSGELREALRAKKATKENVPFHEWMGGVSAEKLAERGQAREDGMALSRVMKLLCGAKYDFMLVADSGPGCQVDNGFIVPRFKGRGENHVVLGLNWDDLSQIVLMTCIHYEAFLAGVYAKRFAK